MLACRCHGVAFVGVSRVHGGAFGPQRGRQSKPKSKPTATACKKQVTDSGTRRGGSSSSSSSAAAQQVQVQDATVAGSGTVAGEVTVTVAVAI